MRYLFAFSDDSMAFAFRRELHRAGITCEVRRSQEFSAGDQGPELWVRDEDYEKARTLLAVLQGET